MAELHINFAFTPGEQVKTPWGEMGIVTDAAVNEEFGQRFFVQGKEKGAWFKPDYLTPWEDEAEARRCVTT